jgi:hypothetical protein
VKKREHSTWGYNWANFLLGDINTYLVLQVRVWMLCKKKNTVAKSKEVKAGWSNS